MPVQEIPSNMIGLLEQYEKHLATEYGMIIETTSEVDSVAMYKKDSSSLSAYQALHQLYLTRVRYEAVKPSFVVDSEQNGAWNLDVG